jgi:hypothetical protein
LAVAIVLVASSAAATAAAMLPIGHWSLLVWRRGCCGHEHYMLLELLHLLLELLVLHRHAGKLDI